MYTCSKYMYTCSKYIYMLYFLPCNARKQAVAFSEGEGEDEVLSEGEGED